MVTNILKLSNLEMGAPPNDLGTWGQGSPEGVHNGAPGQFYFDQANGVLYVKQSGYMDVGWISIFASGSGQLTGVSSPEGVFFGFVGMLFWDSVNKILYIKDTDSGTTGWREIIA